MDKREAIQFLKQSLGEIPHLAKLHYDNHDYPLWHSTIEGVLEKVFGRDSSEYQNFSDARLYVRVGGHQRQEYLQELKLRETVLLSIIKIYERVGFETESATVAGLPPKAFISHGKESVARTKLKEFLRALGIEPLIVKERPSLDKTVDDKVNYYLTQADFVIILATGDDEIKGKLHPRQNVIHEIGLAQKTHPGRIIYLLEEGAEFPSNIRPKVWESFKQRNMMNAFLGIVRELRAYGMLKIIKTPLKEQYLD